MRRFLLRRFATSLLAVLGVLVPTYQSTRNLADVHRLPVGAGERVRARAAHGLRAAENGPAPAGELAGQ